MPSVKDFFKPTLLTVVAVGLLLFRLLFAHIDLEPGAISVLKHWIAAEYTRYHVDREDISFAEKAELLNQAQAVEFLSVSARGKPERMVLRVELAPNSAQPPDSPAIRYFRMEHSLLLGWHTVPRRADALIYFLALFML